MDDRKPRREWWARRLAAGIAAAALLTGGGVVLGTQLASGASPTSSAARVSMHLASDHVTTGATPKHRRHVRRAVRRAVLRRILRLGGEQGQITFRTKKGTKTVVFMRGIIQRAPSGSFAVKDADGSSLTWNLVAKTAVIRAKKRIGVSALATGQRVFVVGPVVGGADEARLIVIRG